MNLRQRIILTVVSYPFVIYAISFILVCLDPYWYDNSPYPEYIPLSDRWSWALVISFFYTIYCFPLLVGVVAGIRYLANRK